MINPWIFATGAVLVGLLSGVVGGALVRSIILKGRDDRPEMHDAARASATFLFLFFSALGVIVAIGFAEPETLNPLPAELIRESPQVLAAGLILIAGRAIAFALGGMIKSAFETSAPRLRSQVGGAVRFLVYSVALVLALSQLGVDTTILSVIAAAAAFGLAGAFALLVGLGGRDLGAELATGRYLQRLMRVGDDVEFDGIAGRVVNTHPASVELRVGDETVHVPNTRVFNGDLRIRHHD